jgi:ligand-binding sensor domain-containing protein
MKKQLIFFLPILLQLLLVFHLRAQLATFNRVVLPTGNSHGIVSGITQDKNGYIWIAT